MRRPGLHRILRATATLGVVALLTLVLLEVLVRALWPQPPPQLWLIPDVRYGHLGKPDFHQRFPFPALGINMEVETNSLGFRDPEPGPRQPGSPTVVLLGDSFTFGHGVQIQERFDTLLREKLQQSGHELRTINLGLSAWGTVQETRYLLDHLDSVQPDVVVLTFCINDPYDDAYFLEHGVSFDRVRFPGKNLLRAHSHLFRALQYVYLSSRKARIMTAEQQAKGGKPTPAQAPASPVPPAAAPPISEAAWDRTREVLTAFSGALEAKRPGTRILFQSTDPLNEDIRRHLGEIAQALPHAEYVDWAKAAASLAPEARIIPGDGHWSAAMHRLSAEALVRKLP